MNNKVLVALSGGIDSTTLLHDLLTQGKQVDLISFKYGSKHGQYENEAARNIAKWFKLPITFINMSEVFFNFKSNLLVNQGEIPEGDYKEESMEATVVPCRNLIFASIMAGIAESHDCSAIAFGVHAGDHHIYPDCRGGFIKSLHKTIKAGTGGKVSTMLTPYLNISKEDIVKKGLGMKTPYTLCRTCYKQQEIACGVCGSCRERLEAFERCGVKDHIPYQNQEN